MPAKFKAGRFIITCTVPSGLRLYWCGRANHFSLHRNKANEYTTRQGVFRAARKLHKWLIDSANDKSFSRVGAILKHEASTLKVEEISNAQGK